MRKNTGKHIWILLLFSPCLFAQVKIGDATLPSSYTAGKDKLLLNGAGMREKYFMDMYAGALYLMQKSGDGQKIIQADEAMAIRLHIVSGLITSGRMEDAVDEGFNNSTNHNITPLKDKIEQFKKVFSEKINVGDVYDIVYLPAEGIVIYKNNIKKVTIPGFDFKKALFGIWLGAVPGDHDLKMAMLGK